MFTFVWSPTKNIELYMEWRNLWEGVVSWGNSCTLNSRADVQENIWWSPTYLRVDDRHPLLLNISICLLESIIYNRFLICGSLLRNIGVWSVRTNLWPHGVHKKTEREITHSDSVPVCLIWYLSRIHAGPWCRSWQNLKRTLSSFPYSKVTSFFFFWIMYSERWFCSLEMKWNDIW